MKQLKAAPYYPETNGLAEIFNGTLKSILGMYANKRASDWDEILS